MEKIKKMFSPGHEKDDEVLYNDSNKNTTSSGASHLPTATGAADHATEVTSAHSGRENNDLRRQALHNEPPATSTSRPGATGNLPSGSGIADDASTASIRSGVLGSGSSPSTHLGTSSSGGHSGLGQHSSLPDRTATDNQRSFPLGSDNTTSATGNSHHGTEGALAGGAGAAGLGAYEANKHRNEGTSVNPGSHSGAQFDPTSHEHKGRGHGYNGDPCPPGDEPQTDGYPHHVPGPHHTDMANLLDPHVPGEFPSDGGEDRHGRNHLGRDAGVAGGIGSAGLGAHEAGRHHHESSTTATPQPLNIQPLSGSSTSQPTEHHHGRDAGLAGAAGAAGVGAYEAHKHHDGSSVPGGSNNTTDRGILGSSSATDRSSHLGNAPTDTTSTHPSRDHHLGRDAALAGGAGTAALGAHEAGSHSHEHGDPLHGSGRFDDQRFDPSAAHGERSTHAPNLTYGSSTPQSGYTGQEPGQQHHYGRDAAVAGGVGAAGVGASEVGKHRAGPKEEDPASYTTGPHKNNLANIVDPRVRPEPEKMKTRETAGPHNSDALNRADPRVDSDLSKQNKDHHYGRDAALAGGAGAAGYGAYEATRGHHTGSDERSPASQTLGSNNPTSAPYGSNTTSAPYGSNTTSAPYGSNTANTAQPGYGSTAQHDPQHHYGRDAALAGGAGAAGLGAHEYGQHRTDPTSVGTTSRTAGPYQSDNLNRADPRVDSDLSRQNKDHHYGRDAALAGGAGAAGLGAHEYGNSRTDPTSRTAGPHQSDNLNRADPRVDSDLSNQNKDHHYGRDAAVAGGAGAAGVGAYEYGKHRNEPSATDPTSRTAGPYQSDNLNRADPHVDSDLSNQNKDHHYGRDAAVAGGAGAAAYGAHEAIDPKHQEKLEKERLKEAEKEQKHHQKDAEKAQKHEQKEAEKEHKAAQKAHDKEVAKEHKAHDKEVAKEHKVHDKEVSKEEKAAHKEHDHEEKRLAALAAAANKDAEKKTERELEHEKGEKKHGLFGFLHHDKSKDPEEEKELRDQNNLREADLAAHERHQGELENDAAAGNINTAGAKFEPSLEEQRANRGASSPQYVSIDDKGHQQVSTGQDGRNRLHKEPPASVRRSLEENRQ